MSHNQTAKFARTVVFLIASFFTFSHLAFGQCGTYFHPGYRAIGKVPLQHNSYFRLDDWTGDGKSDYWNFQSAGATHNILIYPAKPTGYWDWDNPIIYTTTIPSSKSLWRANPIVKDFDGDGRKDFLYVDRIYRNTGSGSLEALAQISLSDQGTLYYFGTLDYVDITGDGRLDWIYGYHFNDGTTEIRYQPGTADGAFAYRVIVLRHDADNDLNNSGFRLGDFNGDGPVDFLLSKSLPGGAMSRYTLLKNLGNGTFQAGPPMELAGDSYGRTADFNSDGKVDIVAESGGNLTILYGQSDGTFSPTVYPGISVSISAIVDLNGDNRPDFLTLEGFVVNAGYRGYKTTINDGMGGYVQTSYNNFIRISVLGLRLEDVSGDGKPDFFDDAANALDSSAGYLTNRNAFGQEMVVVWTNTCERSPFQVHTLNNDITADATMWDPANGRWSYRGPGFSGAVSTANWGTQGDVPSPGDFDGDGIFDLTVYRPSTGVWYALNSSNSTWNVVGFGLPGDKPVPNDYDGDAKTDIAVFRPSDGNWYFLLSRTQQYLVVHFGANGDKPVPADYDGDFKTDIAVYRPNGGVWYYVRSSDMSVGIVPFGIDSDVPVPGDYDGDAKADLAVFRSGVWYILRTIDNSASVFWWGSDGDLPVPLSVNTITPDFVVYRPSNRKWYGFLDWTLTTGSTGQAPVRFGLPNN